MFPFPSLLVDAKKGANLEQQIRATWPDTMQAFGCLSDARVVQNNGIFSPIHSRPKIQQPSRPADAEVKRPEENTVCQVHFASCSCRRSLEALTDGASMSSERRPEIMSKLAIFCDVSSIRGIQKISRGQTPFIRLLWTGFVVTMTCLLAMTTAFLVSDFLNFTTAWHIRTLLDNKTEFPGVTLCGHNPFSLEANPIWANRSMLTPWEFRTRMYNAVRVFIETGEVQYAQSAVIDTTEAFYANLRPHEAFRIGHQDEMFPHCMYMVDGAMVGLEGCRLDDPSIPFVKRQFSHPKYFNCWTIEGKAGPRGGWGCNASTEECDDSLSTAEVSRLILLVRLVPSSRVVEAKDGFVMDTFTRGEGLKLTIHEAGAYPEVEKTGVNVQPSRLNEAIFQTHLWSRLPTPRAPCDDHQPAIRDLDATYMYDFAQCLDTVLQWKSIHECGCLNSEWPRPVQPTDVLRNITYCATLPEHPEDPDLVAGLIQRFHCTYNILMHVKELKEAAVLAGVCKPRCTFFTYETGLSITSWRPSSKKLHHYTQLYAELELFVRELNKTEAQNRFLAYMKDVVEETKGDTDTVSQPNNFDHVKSDPNDQMSEVTEEGLHTIISVVRKDYDTMFKEERLVFDIYILISRVGGLCSLFIGLTTAVLIEMVEFVYLAWLASRRAKRSAAVAATCPSRRNMPQFGAARDPSNCLCRSLVAMETGRDVSARQMVVCRPSQLDAVPEGSGESGRAEIDDEKRGEHHSSPTFVMAIRHPDPEPPTYQTRIDEPNEG
ncbi:unnamed protein product [Protopolystoma xenopodis]|uniref:Uncharacterized protein n=1 Tax=Protopolystoma xenopodis TaxID=117903 RepID=A0A3S5CIA5_9PLAT|nr:unnamed protein product [Protopolystoma xenopodis]